MVDRRVATQHGSSDACFTRAVLTALTVVLVLVAAAALAVAVALASRRVLSAAVRRPSCGPEALVGRLGTVRGPLAPLGLVLVDGSLWRAQEAWSDSAAPTVAGGEPVVVERVDGLTLLVRRAEPWEVEA